MAYFAAIPTTYADVQMRSRLEAKWAAFFDLCGWHCYKCKHCGMDMSYDSGD